WASWIDWGFGLAIGNRVEFSAPKFAATPVVDTATTPPTAMPAPTNAGMTVVESSENFIDLTKSLLFPIEY
ncbi:MAG: hypothetical protein HYY38_07470, partial [Rhodospirillales bacterium]|nr:hypothetical protein [Rhodospirillales bacterium]